MWRQATIASGMYKGRQLWTWDALPTHREGAKHKSMTTGEPYEHPQGYLRSNMRLANGEACLIPFGHVILGSQYRKRVAVIQLFDWQAQKMFCCYSNRHGLAHSLDCGKCQKCCDKETLLISDYHVSPGKLDA